MPDEGLPAGGSGSGSESKNPPEQDVKTAAGGKAGVPPASSGPPPAAAEPKPAAAKPAVPAKPAAPKAPAIMVTTPWEGDLPAQIKQAFPEAVLDCSTYLGQDFVVVKPESIPAVVEYLKVEADYEYLVDVTAVHYPKRTAEEFDLFYVLYSFSRNHRMRVKTRVKDGAAIESVCGVHIGANWLEREVFDMFGIRFENHPDLKRILMPDEWEGYPLRKDYSILKMDERWVQENLGIESAQ